MGDYGLGGNSIAGGCVAVLLVLALATGLILIPKLAADIMNADANREQARAERIEAQARADHLDAVDYQRNFMLWSAFLEVNDDDIAWMVLAFLAVVVASVSGGIILGARFGQPPAK